MNYFKKVCDYETIKTIEIQKNYNMKVLCSHMWGNISIYNYSGRGDKRRFAFWGEDNNFLNKLD